MSTPDRPSREDLPGSGGWAPPTGEPQGDLDPTGRPWERPATEPAPAAAPAAWPGAQSAATPQAPAYAQWPGAEQQAVAPTAVGGARLAGYGARAGAAVIDGLIATAIVLVPTLVGALGFLAGSEVGAIAMFLGLAVGFIAAIAYPAYWLATHNGQTIGKKVTNIRVIKTDGGRLSGGPAFVREVLVKGLLMGGVGQFTFYVLTLLNYLWPLWDSEKDALHDKMCSTRVVEA